jgi:hypothetical protein
MTHKRERNNVCKICGGKFTGEDTFHAHQFDQHGAGAVTHPAWRRCFECCEHVRGWRVFEQRAVKAGETVQAEVRMRLDVTQLPKPFQINAVNTRDWNLSSEWRRFSLLVPNEPPAPAPTPASPPASPPASSPPASGSSGLSPNPGWGMSAGPSSAGTLLAPAK